MLHTKLFKISKSVVIINTVLWLYVIGICDEFEYIGTWTIVMQGNQEGVSSEGPMPGKGTQGYSVWPIHLACQPSNLLVIRNATVV